jgi:hypothetical protein
MSEELKEGNQPLGEQNANSVPSTPAGQPSEADLTKVLLELQGQIKEQGAVIKALQSGKDKRWDSEVKPLRDSVAKIADALGIDPKEVIKAQKAVALDELAEAYMGDRSLPSSGGTGGGNDAVVELQSIVAALDLPANDSRVTSLQLKYAGDPAKFTLEAAALKKQLATAQEPTPAEQPLPGGSTSNLPETDAQKYARIFGGNENPFSTETAKRLGGGITIR